MAIRLVFFVVFNKYILRFVYSVNYPSFYIICIDKERLVI